MNPEKRTILPGMAFRSFATRYKRPQMSEGFQDITEVAFKVRSRHAVIIQSEQIHTEPCSFSGTRLNNRLGLDTGLDKSRIACASCTRMDVLH